MESNNVDNKTKVSVCVLPECYLTSHLLKPKFKVGNFTLKYVDILGIGAYGQVYKMELKNKNGHKSVVAMKLACAYEGEDKNSVKKKLYDEMKFTIAASKNNKHVIAVCDIQKCFIMELCDDDLFNAIFEHSLFQDQEKKISIALQIAHGLKGLHANNIAHHDLRPPNIFLTKNGTIKIADFGMAEYIDSQDVATFGLHYAFPPEASHYKIKRFYSEGRVEKWDIYQFGILLFELFTKKFGKEIFGKASVFERLPAFSFYTTSKPYFSVFEDFTISTDERICPFFVADDDFYGDFGSAIHSLITDMLGAKNGKLTLNPDDRISLDEIIERLTKCNKILNSHVPSELLMETFISSF